MVADQVPVMELVFTAIAVASTWNVSIELYDDTVEPSWAG